MGSMMTAAMVEASCSVTSRSSSSAKLSAVLGQAARERVPGQVVGMRQMIDAGQHRVGPHLAVGQDAAHRNTAETDTVIATLAADEPRPRRFASGAVVRERDLERGVDRLRAGVCEEHVVQPGRRDLDQLVRQLERGRVSHLERRRVVHRFELAGRRLR